MMMLVSRQGLCNAKRLASRTDEEVEHKIYPMHTYICRYLFSLWGIISNIGQVLLD